MQGTTDALKGAWMRSLKAFFGTTTLLGSLALTPAAQAQLIVNMDVQP
jgi:hypothetical protein